MKKVNKLIRYHGKIKVVGYRLPLITTLLVIMGLRPRKNLIYQAFRDTQD